MSLCTQRPGTYSLVVDRGRPGVRHRGVPTGGAFDRCAYAIANALIGNRWDATAIEITSSGPSFECLADCEVAVFGAAFEIRVNDLPRESAHVFALHKGEQLAIGACTSGMRGYLVVGGGFVSPRILGSTTGLTPLPSGDRFDVYPSEWNCRGRSLGSVSAAEFLDLQFPQAIRILPGPEAAWISSEAIAGQKFTLTPASNRMGLRLASEPLVVRSAELASTAVVPGTVQVTPDGQCIILGVDGQTIGGYPQVAHVITADLDRLAQLRPGSTICFRWTTLEEAEAMYQQTRQRLAHAIRLLELR